MAGDLKNFIYTDDFGNKYRVRLDAGNAAQMGFPTAADTDKSPPLPSAFRMRRVRFVSPDERVKRELFAPTRDSVKLKPGATVTLPIYNEGNQTNAVFKIKGRTGERQTYT